ncbi:septum formation initiator [Sphaerimonospora mesophila]|uniref:septum formation initiator n=1 Tax=Sphaerimonospora mesophila TaxID=37483 RepID=UPI000A994DE2
MIGRLALAIAGWLVAAVLASGAGVMLISLFGGHYTDAANRPMTPDEVRSALTLSRDPRAASGSPGSPSHPSSPNAASSPSPSELPGRPSPGTETRVRLIPTAGGHVIAGCEGGLARLRSWTPAQGFQADDVEPGPDDKVRVKFESDDPDIEIEVEVRCVGGAPDARVTEHD